MSGVNTILKGNDVLGKYQVGLILPDQPLFATEKFRYFGDFVALLLCNGKERNGRYD